MSNLEKLKTKQDVVFNILNNSMRNDRLAHAYLFSGISGSLQYETAYLFAASLVCENSTWSCGQCESCQRILSNQYPDFIVLDGSQSSIKKEDVIALQSQFSMTALEKSAYKIFLIKEAHNMTISAANSLLKFLEEPSSSVVGILVSDQSESLLPTIVSRCTELDFKKLSDTDNYELALSIGLDIRDAYYFSKVASNYFMVDTFFEQEAYQLFRVIFEKFIKSLLKSEDAALFVIQTELLKHSDKEVMNQAFDMFIQMLIVFFKDVINNNSVDQVYDDLLLRYRNENKYMEYLSITLNIKNKVRNHINLALLMDQFIYQFKEVK